MTDQPDPKPLSETEREDLVAYLDGELGEEEARAVESKLNLDARARTEADELQRAWDLLDYLPQAEPSPTFTERTVSRIAALRPAAPTAGVRRRRLWAVGFGWAAAVLVAAAAGFAGVTFLVPEDRTDEELARDLRVIENRRLYEPVPDIYFLWELSHPDLFGDEGPGS
jgi:anti-sigma factor RsiW